MRYVGLSSIGPMGPTLSRKSMRSVPDQVVQNAGPRSLDLSGVEQLPALG
jgi:hypothetical protein